MFSRLKSIEKLKAVGMTSEQATELVDVTIEIYELQLNAMRLAEKSEGKNQGVEHIQRLEKAGFTHQQATVQVDCMNDYFGQTIATDTGQVRRR
jgi:hypothetical protein